MLLLYTSLLLCQHNADTLIMLLARSPPPIYHQGHPYILGFMCCILCHRILVLTSAVLTYQGTTREVDRGLMTCDRFSYHLPCYAVYTHAYMLSTFSKRNYHFQSILCIFSIKIHTTTCKSHYYSCSVILIRGD